MKPQRLNLPPASHGLVKGALLLLAFAAPFLQRYSRVAQERYGEEIQNEERPRVRRGVSGVRGVVGGVRAGRMKD